MPRLSQGTLAPDFEGTTLNGETVRLSQFKGKKVWLCIYRYARCPLCILHLSDLRRYVGAIRKAGVEIIAVFESHPRDFGPFFENSTETLPRSLIADPEKKIYRLYGAEKNIWAAFQPQVVWTWLRAQFSGYFQGRADGELLQVPAQFLIREDGVLHTVFYGDHLADHLNWWRIQRFLREETVEEWNKRVKITHVSGN